MRDRAHRSEFIYPRIPAIEDTHVSLDWNLVVTNKCSLYLLPHSMSHSLSQHFVICSQSTQSFANNCFTIVHDHIIPLSVIIHLSQKPLIPLLQYSHSTSSPLSSIYSIDPMIPSYCFILFLADQLIVTCHGHSKYIE